MVDQQTQNYIEKRREDGTTEQPHYPVWQWLLTLLGLYLGALLYGLDTTIAADVQSAAYQTFDNIELLPWIGLGFPLGSVAVILFYGRLYSLFNIKVLINISIILFETGSALCGAAPNMTALLIGRVVAGIGGCGMYIGALNYISALGSPEKIPLYNALIGVFWGTGAILGPVVGGAFSVSNATWRWAFYINLPLAALLAPVYIFVTPSFTWRPNESLQKKFNGFDWIGIILNAAVFVLAITATAISGSEIAWNSTPSIVMWTLTGVVLIVYAIQQALAIGTAKESRIYPVHFLKSKDMILTYVATACSATANAVSLYYIPLFFVFTQNDTALEAAVRLLPYICIFIFAVMISGGTLPLVRRYAIYYTIGGVLILTGSALLFTINMDTSISRIYGYEVLVAAGSGICFQNGYAIAAAKVSAKDKSNAIGFINIAQIGTTAISLAIAACLYINLGFGFMSNVLDPNLYSGSFIKAALGGAGAKVLQSVPPETVEKIIETVAFTISRLFGMVIAAGALLIVFSLFMLSDVLDMSADAIGIGG